MKLMGWMLMLGAILSIAFLTGVMTLVFYIIAVSSDGAMSATAWSMTVMMPFWTLWMAYISIK